MNPVEKRTNLVRKLSAVSRETDLALERQFKSQSSVTTYLTSVLVNLGRDLRTKELGKWRPSAAALRHGAVAVELERMIHRDGRSAEEAVRTLLGRDKQLTESGLHSVFESLPLRTAKPFLFPVDLVELPSECSWGSGSGAEEQTSAGTKLRKVMRDLDRSDRRLLRARFFDVGNLSRMARVKGVPYTALYRRCSFLLARLRSLLKESGYFDAAAVRNASGGLSRSLFESTGA